MMYLFWKCNVYYGRTAIRKYKKQRKYFEFIFRIAERFLRESTFIFSVESNDSISDLNRWSVLLILNPAKQADQAFNVLKRAAAADRSR